MKREKKDDFIPFYIRLKKEIDLSMKGCFIGRNESREGLARLQSGLLCMMSISGIIYDKHCMNYSRDGLSRG